MLSINRVILIGNLTKDPELRYTPQGVPVCELRLAANERFGRGENKREKTLFIDVVVWREAAENSAKYLQKGQSILVEGRLEQDQWQDKETGAQRSRIRIVADNVRFGPKSQGGGGGGYGGGDSQGYNRGPARQGGGYGNEGNEGGNYGGGAPYEGPAGDPGPAGADLREFGLDDQDDVPF